MNNHGVELVSKGFYEHAIPCFTRSLDMIRPFLTDAIPLSIDPSDDLDQHIAPPLPEEKEHQPLNTSDNSVPSSSHGLSSPPDTSIDEHPRKRPRKTMPTTAVPDRASVSKEHDPDQAFVFRDPIEVPEIAFRSRPSKRLFAKLSMVALFNLGLSFHLCALDQSSVIKLVQAKDLYELAFQMHLEENCDVTLLYSLALMNNLGLIYHVLGDHTRSGNCFNHMLSTMMFLLESQDAHSIKQWDGLLSNVMGLVFPEPPKAAAA